MNEIAPQPTSTVGPKGEIANPALIEHSAKFEPRRWTVADRVHSLVGWGLANCTVIEAPEGLIVVDSGECVEEAADHVAEIRSFTDAPVAAFIYSHFHYVNGTAAWFQGSDPGTGPNRPDPTDGVPIWAHHLLPANVAASAAETGPSWVRRGITQFGAFLPTEGPDAMPNMGIGPFMFNPAHTIRTPGHLSPTRLVTDFPAEIDLAGMKVVFHSAPSDSDDSMIIHLPELGVAINNNLWPALFNIYPLRGEPYRDPQILLTGLDLLRDLEPEHLVGVHGPPISGRELVQEALLDYRDSIEFLWDQTVRGINHGVDPDVLAQEVVLPPRLANSPWLKQHYGLVRHHVRQIHGGVLGWWGNDGAELVSHHPADEARRIVEGFGGRDEVLAQLRAALCDADAPWAARLGSWLVKADPGDDEARKAKAAALREIGQATTSANVRAFVLTEARELEGLTDRSFMTTPMISRHTAMTAPPETFLRSMRVLLDPELAADVHTRLVVDMGEGIGAMALRVRGGVAAFEILPRGPADILLRLDLAAWADLVSAGATIRELIESRRLVIGAGTLEDLATFIAVFPDSTIRVGS